MNFFGTAPKKVDKNEELKETAKEWKRNLQKVININLMFIFRIGF